MTHHAQILRRALWVKMCLNMQIDRTSKVVAADLNCLLLALALMLALSFPNCVVATTLVGKVIGVQDGDTIEVLDSSKHSHRIRLAGIDAPEEAQPLGQRSKQNLSGLVFGKQVEVDGGKTDKYGRTLGKVVVNGADANLTQVKAGFASHYKHCTKLKFLPSFV